MNKGYEVTIESGLFDGFKSDFNQLLRNIISNMIDKGGEKAEMRIVLKITLTEGETPDLEEVRYEAQRETIIPKFEHKITTVMQYKNEKDGFVGGAEYELIWDKDRAEYVMLPIKDAQIGIFEADDGYGYDNPELD